MTLLAAGFAASAAAQTTAKDHPLISRYPGSEIKVTFGQQEYSVKEFDEIALPMGPYQKGKFTKTERVEGKVTRLGYVNPRDRSTLEIFRNYQQALTKGGFQTLFACSAAECGGEVLNEPTPDLGYWCANSNVQCPEPMRYIVAKLPRAAGDVYAAVKVRTEETYLIVVELKPMQAGMVTVNAQALADDITKSGHVAVYGIYFDTGKSIIKPESKPVVDEIAKLLNLQVTLKLHVVGHTDNVGTLASNMTLSKQRAEAVVNALVNDHRIAAARLIANGVGPLAPVASNAADEGRAKNRRVELVGQ
jgi:outer membrane protein OmpA-like peptidoglycan-associated protein